MSDLQAQLTEVLKRNHRHCECNFAPLLMPIITAALSAALLEGITEGREKGIVHAFDLIGDERVRTLAAMDHQQQRGLDVSWHYQRLKTIEELHNIVRSAARGVQDSSDVIDESSVNGEQQ